MRNNFSNVMDYKVVADTVIKFNEEMKSFVMEDYNDAISSAKDFADAYGDDCVENQYLCGTMDYDYDIREMWADFAWHGDVCDTFKDARDFYDEHKDLFISMEDIDNLVRGLDGTDDVGDGECLVWVRNPYYVDTDNNMEENNMSNEMVNNVDLFNVYVKDVLVNEYNNACDSTIDACFDSENEYECGNFIYDYDIRKMWVDFCTNVIDVYDMDRDDLYNYYDSNRDMFISVDDLDEVVDGFENTDDVGDGECLVWVRNPYYVEQEQVKNDSPCLDDVDRVVKVIEGYVNNYTMSYLDNYGGCVVCVPWDVFNEDDMKMLIEDADFEEYVVDVLMGRDIKDVLVYDDGVYVSVDADMFDKVA